MARHDLDPVALLFGALFTVTGLAYATGRWSWFDTGGAWLLALLLVGVGLAGVLTAGRSARTRRRDARAERTELDAETPSPTS